MCQKNCINNSLFLEALPIEIWKMNLKYQKLLLYGELWGDVGGQHF